MEISMFRYMKLAFERMYITSPSLKTQRQHSIMHLSDAVRNPAFSVCWVYIVQNTKRHHQSLLQISERQFVILMKACILRIRRCYKSLWNKGRTSIQGQAMHVRSARQNSPNIRIFGLFCATPFRTRDCAPCVAKRLSLRTCYLRTI